MAYGYIAEMTNWSPFGFSSTVSFYAAGVDSAFFISNGKQSRLSCNKNRELKLFIATFK